jgi:Family of unknown function (DUF6350)
MTDLLARPEKTEAASTPPASGSTGHPSVASTMARGLLAAGWTAAMGILLLVAVSVAGWFAADTGSFGDAIRVGGLAWLVSNGGGLQLRSAAVTLVPLGAVLVVGAVLYRAGRWVGSRVMAASWQELAAGIGSLAAGYAAAAAIVTTATRLPGASVSATRVVAGTCLLGAIFGGLGVLSGAARLSGLVARLPEEVRAACTGGLAGVLGLTSASAALFTISLVRHFPVAVTVAEKMHAGVVGGAIATLVGLALVPNAVLFAGAFLAGPGFALGTGTVVAPGDVSTGPVPGFPLLAAVPRSAGEPWLDVMLLIVPVLAGAGAGLLAVRRFPVRALDAAAIRGALAGLAAGGGFGLLALLSAGSVGPGRMQQVGPAPEVIWVCALACAVGGAVTAAGSRWVQASRASTVSVS